MPADAAHAGVLRRLVRVVGDPLDLGRVVQQLGVLDLAGQAGQVHVPERPGEQVQVEPVAASACSGRPAGR